VVLFAIIGRVLLVQEIIYLIDEHFVIHNDFGNINKFELVLTVLDSFSVLSELFMGLYLLLIYIVKICIEQLLSHSRIYNTFFNLVLNPLDSCFMIVFENGIFLKIEVGFKLLELLGMFILLAGELFS